MIYLIRFDQDGRRQETYVKDEKTPEEVQELLDQGYIEIPETDYQLLLGNIDGQEYIRVGDGQYKPYVPPEPTEEEKYEQAATEVRAKRDQLLAETDFFLTVDYPANDPTSDSYSPEAVALVKEYRKALRDITDQEGFPFEVTYPDIPVSISKIKAKAKSTLDSEEPEPSA